MARRYKIVLVIIIMVSLGCILAYLWYTKPGEVDIETEATAMSVNSEKLIASFTKNEEFATSLYVEKVLEIEGVVKRVSLANERVTVVLEGAVDSSSVLCDFSHLYQDKALRLKNGEHIRVKGICKGFLKDVIVLNCKIVNP